MKNLGYFLAQPILRRISTNGIYSSITHFGKEEMLCKVKFKDYAGTCYLQGDYNLTRECANPGNENYLVKKLNELILPKLSINNFKLSKRGKNGWCDVECWEYSPIEHSYGSEIRGDNKIIKTIRLKINPFKLNLGTLELMVDKK